MAGRDLPFGEDARRHLVEQRLEEVVVGAVDDRDPDRLAAERPGGEEAAEAAADDHDVVAGVGAGAGACSQHRSTTVST